MPQETSRIDLHDVRIAIVGAGSMGQAILAGLIGATNGEAVMLSARNFCVVNPSAAKRELVEGLYGIRTYSNASELPPCDIVIIAVRPNVVVEALGQLAQHDWAANALFISVAAGVTTASIEAALPEGARVVRAMPNIPLRVSLGATGLSAGSCATEQDLDLAVSLFAGMGEAVAVEEDQIDTVTAISGSGPAYVAALVAALADAGSEAGLDRQVAEALARATAEGTGAYMRAYHLQAQETCDEICVPGGTTEAAMAAMEDAGYSESLKKGVRAAIARARELGA